MLACEAPILLIASDRSNRGTVPDDVEPYAAMNSDSMNFAGG
jgi:hypothetical protein